MDTLRGVESFVRSVEEGSIAAAARKLGITPAAASQNIARLERTLGTRLLSRTTRQLGLTESGRIYYDRVRGVIHDLEQAAAAVSMLNDEPRGSLKIASSVTFGRHVIAPLVPPFAARHPDVSIELVITDRSTDHIGEGIDISIRFGQQLEPGLIARKLASVPMMICAAPSYIARRGRPETPEELQHHDCLTYRFAVHGRLFRWGFVRDGARFEPELRSTIISNDIDTLAQMAIAGAGVARLGAFIANPLIEQGLLVPLFSGDTTRGIASVDHEPLDFYACFLDRHAETPKIRAFIEHAVKSLKGRW
ncbi:LysR family transcriptional regulator [Sinorhizobium numidicum]|uniref:LysR family transcriptional regulator n=1 Tax=Sinorhizobium numidicum TaxID=680248 RepID=A0ABY8D3P8_9HYPH|nr:LysR family transcriptional regulator [Sinorhizobium numidicum]WEX78338.1 LysR family transcriptional regulator [Sinorhizobium numidicum]WEX84997.1 LysR family transcriptional regulator [Sinorhizobium numidicum]